jgi:hypothetical protein
MPNNSGSNQISEVYWIHSEILHTDLGLEDSGLASGSQKYQDDARNMFQDTLNSVPRYNEKLSDASTTIGRREEEY